ncbi:hypothetical protein Tco_0345173 [Tanacetum coccineum]
MEERSSYMKIKEVRMKSSKCEGGCFMVIKGKCEGISNSGYPLPKKKNLFETTMRRVHTFVPMESESKRVIPELAAGSSKRNAEEELEIYTEGARKYWKIIRVGNHTKVYQFFDDMIKAFDKEDLVKLWSLVKEKFTSTDPTEDKERELWVELKRLFEPDTDDELWKLQKHIHDNLTWRLYDSCGVHHVSTEDGIDICMLVEKEYPLSRGTLTLMLVAKLLVEQDSEMSRELLRKIFMQVERPRR